MNSHERNPCLVFGSLCRLILVPDAPALGITANTSLDRRDSLEIAVNDDRVAAMIWANEQLERTDPDTQPVRWMRALWFYLEVNEYRSDYDIPEDFGTVAIPDLKQALEKAIRIAEQENLIDDLYDLRGMLEDERAKDQQTAKDPQSIKADFEARINEARQSGFKPFRARHLLEQNKSVHAGPASCG